MRNANCREGSGSAEHGAARLTRSVQKKKSTEMSMEQRSCGMRIAVTEREAICFNAKRTKKEVHGNEHEAT